MQPSIGKGILAGTCSGLNFLLPFLLDYDNEFEITNKNNQTAGDK